MICCANQLTGFYMRATLALNGLTCVSFQGSTRPCILLKLNTSKLTEIGKCIKEDSKKLNKVEDDEFEEQRQLKSKIQNTITNLKRSSNAGCKDQTDH